MPTRRSRTMFFASFGQCLALLGASNLYAADEPVKASSAVFSRAAVAADHALASQAGAEILKQGGNAVDAAVATSFALSVVRPFSCGIGGGGFLVVYLREHPKMKIAAGGLRTAINYREMAPAFAVADYYEKDNDPKASIFGGKAVGIPGTVAGLLDALETLGTMDRAAVMAPAIRLAREGFAADEAFVEAVAEVTKDFEKHPEFQKRFAFVWERFCRGGAVKVGDVIKLPEQGDALELLVKEGAGAFYSGAIGAALVKAIGDDGGAMTAADLKSFRVEHMDPLTFTFEHSTLLTMPPPSSGGITMAETLGILELVHIEDVAQKRGVQSPQYVHLVTEAFKHAFADRAEWLGDPKFVDVPVSRLLSPAYLTARAKSVEPLKTFPPDHYGTREQLTKDGGTSHLSVVDAQGNAAACTETINLDFGSLLAVSAYGFVLNDQMDDFTTHRGKANAFGLVQSDRNLPAPGKRPLSSMSPTIVLNKEGAVQVVAGASGGPRIVSATTEVILLNLLAGRGAGEAVTMARFHHQWLPNVLVFERTFDARHEGLRVIDWMRKLHHEVKEKAPADATGVVQMITRVKRGTGDALEAASDGRKGGAPAGVGD